MKDYFKFKPHKEIFYIKDLLGTISNRTVVGCRDYSALGPCEGLFQTRALLGTIST